MKLQDSPAAAVLTRIHRHQSVIQGGIWRIVEKNHFSSYLEKYLSQIIPLDDFADLCMGTVLGKGMLRTIQAKDLHQSQIGKAPAGHQTHKFPCDSHIPVLQLITTTTQQGV